MKLVKGKVLRYRRVHLRALENERARIIHLRKKARLRRQKATER